MLNNYNRQYYGSINFNTSAKAAKAVALFLNKNLSHFPKFFKSLGITSFNEDIITSKLEIFLQRQARSSNQIFMFQFQTPELNSRRATDISLIYASPFNATDSFFVIEAKRLPTPGSGRQREYVQGNLGAIERFKRNHHGGHLQQSAIFAYIESRDFASWHFDVCSWIEELIKTNIDKSIVWNTNDLLLFEKNMGCVNLYKSTNARLGSSELTLSHYWININ